MKKMFVIIMALCAAVSLLILAGCSKTAGTGNAPDVGTQNAAADNVGLTEADIALCYQGSTYSINRKADGLLAALGEEYSYEEAESCAYDGLDKFYEYRLDSGDVTVFTIPLLDGEDTICQIEATSPLFSTPKGITIGSTQEEVERAYGTDCVVDGDNHYYFAGEQSFADTPHIYFTIVDGRVMMISIYSARNHG